MGMAAATEEIRREGREATLGSTGMAAEDIGNEEGTTGMAAAADDIGIEGWETTFGTTAMAAAAAAAEICR